MYQIYVRSFADSDGDGVGDLPGATSRLAHVAALGADAVWLTPFYRSPMADGGYDIADHRDVDPVFGTLADAEDLVTEAHRLGLRVIVDVVPNHTSDQHPWFREALASAPGSPARARYIFRDGRGPDGSLPPSDWQSVFGGSAWQRTADGQWYLHLFVPEQPDLDWSHPEVRADFESILCFWLDRGVDGFRIDVAHGMAKDLVEPLRDLGPDQVHHGIVGAGANGSHPLWDRDEVHDILRGWRARLDTYEPPRAAVAESWAEGPRRVLYTRPDELHQAFNFDFLQAPWEAAGLRRVIDTSLAAAHAVGAAPTWVLSNHDVVRHASRLALPPHTDPNAWLLSGGTQPQPDSATVRRRARAAALLLLALPGAAYLYQGEELGLPEVADLPDGVLQDPVRVRSRGARKGRDGCRVPLPWQRSGPSLGFGSVAPWLPQPADWPERSVAAQSDDPDSVLSLYRAALGLRRHYGGDGDLAWLESDSATEALAFRRGTGLVCTVNLGSRALPLPAGDVLLASGHLDKDPSGRQVIPADTAVWLLSGPQNGPAAGQQSKRDPA
ncbi:glycoside hydrolase family 13 protein [Streptomyces flaveolus]|uniref:Glycoside hydrolase family 13 protein n=1 Tax=Streptomyces flaveolus TaxID=67297 RepID=A0ABV3AMZ7_9ACTN|nr:MULTISPECIES: glycoside hydrolase family 13 protein [Streptomyces]